jgi:hypothetical protein
LFTLSLPERQVEFAQLILLHAAFNRTLELYFQKTDIPAKEEVVAIMKTSELYNIESESTFHRRASTILSWIHWILSLIEE